MSKLLGISNIIVAMIVLIATILISNNIVSLYQEEDARQLSETLETCAKASTNLSDHYLHFHNDSLPVLQENLSSAREFVAKLSGPAQFMYGVSCFHPGYYPFEKWQEPIRTFRDQNIPNAVKALKSAEQLLDEFKKKASPQINRSLPQISTSLHNISRCVAQQEQLNHDIALTLRLLGFACSMLLFITGIYYLHPSFDRKSSNDSHHTWNATTAK